MKFISFAIDQQSTLNEVVELMPKVYIGFQVIH